MIDRIISNMQNVDKMVLLYKDTCHILDEELLNDTINYDNWQLFKEAFLNFEIKITNDKNDKSYILAKRTLRNLELIHLYGVQRFNEQKTFKSDINLDGFNKLAELSERELSKP